MKRILEIGPQDSIFLLENALNNPDNLYYGIDNGRLVTTPGSPVGIYNQMKGRVVQEATGKYFPGNPKFSEYELRIKTLLEQITWPTTEVLSNEQYFSIIRESIRKLENTDLGRRILSEKVGDVFESDRKLYSEFFRIMPELKNYYVKEFLKSKIPRKLEKNLRKLLENVFYIVADGRNLPFIDDLFDFTYARAVNIEDEFDNYVEEVSRVIKSNKHGTHYPSPHVMQNEFPDGIRIDKSRKTSNLNMTSLEDYENFIKENVK